VKNNRHTSKGVNSGLAEIAMYTMGRIRSNFDSLQDVWLFLQIFALATILPPLVKLMTVPRLMKILTPGESRLNSECDKNDIMDKIGKYTHFILSRDFWIYKDICLKRSLIIYHFLRKHGIHVTVCFGVKYKNKQSHAAKERKIEGHAWLLYNGSIFLEKNVKETEKYKMTYCYPGIKADMNKKGFSAGIEGLM
jgi:acylphosphatase